MQVRHLRQIEIPLIFSAVLCIGSFIVGSKAGEGTIRSIFLLFVVLFFGVYLMEKEKELLNDNRIRYLSYLFLLKILLCLVLVNIALMRSLETMSVIYGFDAGRYYYQADELVRVGFDPHSANLTYSLNYKGILFYYGIIFLLFGHNPFTPLLVNCFITLLATILMLKVGYALRREIRPTDWTLGLVMFVPEITWYDVLSSRETLTMSLLCFSIIPFINLSVHKKRFLPKAFWIYSFVAILGLIAVRPPMALIAILVVTLFCCFIPMTYSRLLSVALLAVVMGTYVSIIPKLVPSLGGYEFNIKTEIASRFVQSQLSEQSIAKHEKGWTENSIGQKLIPKNIRLLTRICACYSG